MTTQKPDSLLFLIFVRKKYIPQHKSALSSAMDPSSLRIGEISVFLPSHVGYRSVNGIAP